VAVKNVSDLEAPLVDSSGKTVYFTDQEAGGQPQDAIPRQVATWATRCLAEICLVG
jgi:hypothetical protein